MRLPQKYQKLKKQIQNYLEVRKLYDSVDTMLLEEIVFNKYLADVAKQDIVDNGITVNISKTDGKEWMQTNQAVNVYQQAVKNINAIAVKLALNPQERKKLKISDAEQGDLFDSML